MSTRFHRSRRSVFKLLLTSRNPKVAHHPAVKFQTVTSRHPGVTHKFGEIVFGVQALFFLMSSGAYTLDIVGLCSAT
jgi:hypothetical protein